MDALMVAIGEITDLVGSKAEVISIVEKKVLDLSALTTEVLKDVISALVKRDLQEYEIAFEKLKVIAAEKSICREMLCALNVKGKK